MALTTAEKIAEAALQVLEKEGAEAVSMRRIAKAVEITPMAIYHHFATREALLKTVTDREFEKLLGLIEARRKKLGPNPKTKAVLVDLMEGYIDYAFAYPQVFDYVFSKNRPDARQFPNDFRERRSPTLNPIADAVSDGIRSGVLEADDQWEVALELWALAHGYIALYRGGRFHVSDDEFRALCRRALKRLLNGIKS